MAKKQGGWFVPACSTLQPSDRNTESLIKTMWMVFLCDKALDRSKWQENSERCLRLNQNKAAPSEWPRSKVVGPSLLVLLFS